MITKAWIQKAKQLGRLDDSDSPKVIEACYAIFGLDLGVKDSARPCAISLSTQLTLLKDEKSTTK